MTDDLGCSAKPYLCLSGKEMQLFGDRKGENIFIHAGADVMQAGTVGLAFDIDMSVIGITVEVDEVEAV